MAYLGNSPVLSQQEYRNIDNISGSFNGSTTSFALLVNGVAPVPAPQSSNQCLISVNGVVQKPDDTGATGFRLSGGNIVFSAAPTSGQSFFGVILAGADYIYAGQNFPDGTVSAPPITFNQDLDTGFYRSGSGEVKFTANGANAITLSSNNLTAPSFVPTSSAAPTNGVYLSAANTVAIATNSTGKLFVNSSGQVGIGTSSPRALVDFGSGSGDGTLSQTVSQYQAVFESPQGTGDIARNIAFAVGVNGIGAAINATDEGASDATGIDFATGTAGAIASRLRIDSSGRVGIGTTSPVANRKLTIKNDGTNGGIAITNTADETVGLFIGENVSTSQELGIYSLSNMRFYTGSAGGTQRAAIDTSGRLLVGTSSTSSSALLQVQGNSSSSTGDAIIQLRVGKNNAGILSGNSLGSIQFSNTESTVSAVIEAVADANWNTTNDYPSRLVFSTTADGASSPTERMRIDSVGRTLINFQTPGSGGTAPLQVRASDSGAWGINLLMRNSGNDYGYFTFLDNDASEVLGAIYCERSGASLGNVIVETNNAGGSTARLKIANDGQLSAVVPGNSTLYPGYMCRAWVNFNGTGTVAIRANGNVSSITDNSTGDYTVNFTTAMPDANYAACIMGGSQLSTGTRIFMEQHDNVLRSTTQLRIYTLNQNFNTADTAVVSVAIFR